MTVSPPSVFTRLLVCLVLLTTAIGALACLWVAWCEFPFYHWNDLRLAPAFALRHGINPYPLLHGGPLSTWIYGPVGIIVNLPATFAPSAKNALQVAGAVNLLTLLAPLAVIFFGSAELRARGPAASWIALALSVLLIPRLDLILQVADHSAIACGLLSCWCLARRPIPGGTWIIGAAALCALAVWAKQIAVFLPVAQLGFLLIAGKRREAGCFLAWFAAFNLLAIAMFVPAFGLANLRFNLITIPARLGWTEFMPRIALRWKSLIAQIGVPAVGLIFCWLSGLWPNRRDESGRFFQLCALVFVVMLPVGLLAFFKVGGDINLLHSWDYLMPASLLAWLARDHVGSAASTRLFIVAAGALTLRGSDLASLPGRPYTQPFDFAAQLTATYPHSVWFPQNPVITFYADQRLWDSEDGLSTRWLAGYGVYEADFRRHLPPNLLAIAYPAVNTSPFAVPLLPEFSRKIRWPYWIVYTHPPSDVLIP